MAENGSFWHFQDCKLADAQFIPYFVRDRLRPPVCGAYYAPCHRTFISACKIKTAQIKNVSGQFLCVKQWDTMNLSGSVKWIDVGIDFGMILCEHRHPAKENSSSNQMVKNNNVNYTFLSKMQVNKLFPMGWNNPL